MAVLLGTASPAKVSSDFEVGTALIGTRLVAGASGTIDTISVKVDTTNTWAGTVDCAIFSDAGGGVPVSRIGNVGTITSSAGASTKTSTTGLAAAVTSGVTYWIVFRPTGTTAQQWAFETQNTTAGNTRDSGTGQASIGASWPAGGSAFPETMSAWASDAAAVTEFPPPILVMTQPQAA